jgi:hypothetical protein
VTDPLEAARIIGRYINATAEIRYRQVGNGPYAIVSRFDDHGQFISYLGFESSGDAEVYAAFLRAQLKLDPEPPRPEIVAINGMLAMIPPQDTAHRVCVGFTVVAIVEALPSDVLARLMP